MLASVGGNGTIMCQPEAVPRPTITFYKNNQLLSVSTIGGHFILNPSGELTITNVQKSDEGVYRCEAVNNLGKATSTTNLTVVSKYNNVYLFIYMVLKIYALSAVLRIYSFRLSAER